LAHYLAGEARRKTREPSEQASPPPALAEYPLPKVLHAGMSN